MNYLPGNILKNIDIPVKAEAPQQANPEQLKFEVEAFLFCLNVFQLEYPNLAASKEIFS